jgi:ABC-type dipeptide/oligopeptide/nickel transport system permease subunit
MATEIEKHTSFPGAIDPDELVAQTEAGGGPGQIGEVRARGYWESVWLRLRKDKLALVGAGFIVFLFIVAFAGAPLAAHLLGHSPNDPFFSGGGVDSSLLPAKPWTHVTQITASGHNSTQLLILGGDSTLGRDEFLRVLYGAQVSIEVGIGSTVLSMVIGLLLGSLAGFLRGWVDTIISRLTEITMAFPYLLFVIALASTVGTRLDSITFGFLGQGVVTLVIVFGLFSWFYPARVFRGITLSLREKEFVEAARMVGASERRIIRSHILPHLTGPVIVFSTLNVAQFILAEAGLSFLGLGIKLPTASWGNLLEQATEFITTRPQLMLWPGIALVLTTLAFNLLGDGLRDAFDPRSTRR